jgi:hypothetical protein
MRSEEPWRILTTIRSATAFLLILFTHLIPSRIRSATAILERSSILKSTSTEEKERGGFVPPSTTTIPKEQQDTPDD